MKVFIQTFVICMVLCVGWWVFSYLYGSGFGPDFKVDNEIFTNTMQEEEPKIEEEPAQEPAQIKVYFIDKNNNIRASVRTNKKNDLETSINTLLEGVNADEKSKGMYSEIPKGVRLLGLDNKNGKIIINLNSQFVQGGGTQSVMNRIKQLVKTVNAHSGKEPIYLHIEGKQVEYIGGDGVYLQQPLNEDMLEGQ